MTKRINSNLDESSGWGRFVADIRGHLHAHQNWVILAADAGVAPQTVSKLAYGETKSPHGLTIFKLMVALGREDELLAAVHSEEPVVVREAKKLRPPKNQRRATALRIREERQTKTHGYRKLRRSVQRHASA
jgi:transcriptional regulator with XRE-family HTH domain